MRTRPLPFRRLECAPGAEAQADFGSGAPIIGADGKRRRTHVLRLGLSFSRKAYSEAFFQQTTDNLLSAFENAFRHWGGVPRTLVIDNLRAAVAQADWYDPELHPKIVAFCQHYGTVVLPTKPYTPRHKGKIERGIGYVKSNALERARPSPRWRRRTRHLAATGNRKSGRSESTSTAPPSGKSGRVFAEVEKSVICCRCRQRAVPFIPRGRKRMQKSTAMATSKSPRRTTRCRRNTWDTLSGRAGTARLVRLFNQSLRADRPACPRATSWAEALRAPNRCISRHEKISGSVERGAADHLLNKARD